MTSVGKGQIVIALKRWINCSDFDDTLVNALLKE